ncbi:MAG: hypothetical protein ABR538_18345 [Candidatus Binatia bacterium]
MTPGSFASRSATFGLLAFILTLGGATPSRAALRDCGQPLSDGDGPVASDCLHVLRAAVGTVGCEDCICDLNASASQTASDALLCLRSAVGQEVELACLTCCYEPLDPQPEQIIAAFGLDANGDFEPPPYCETDTKLCCPGGVPSPTCGPVHVDMVEATPVIVVGQNSVDLTMRMRLATVTPLSVTVPLVGECMLEIDTNPGGSPTIRIDARLGLDADGLRIQSIQNSSVTELTTDDVALTGSFGCQIANSGLGFFLDQIETILQEAVSPFLGICLGQKTAPAALRSEEPD